MATDRTFMRISPTSARSADAVVVSLCDEGVLYITPGGNAVIEATPSRGGLYLSLQGLGWEGGEPLDATETRQAHKDVLAGLATLGLAGTIR